MRCIRMYLTSTNTGNTGSYLTDTGSVYITRDGGLTWEQVCMYISGSYVHIKRRFSLTISYVIKATVY